MSKGDQLELTAAYDNGLPHTRVMSIMMAYLAPGEVDGCQEVPDDVEKQDVPESFRKPYPRFRVPLMAPPTGAFKPLGSGIGVSDYFFSKRRVVVERGTPVTWSFDADAPARRLRGERAARVRLPVDPQRRVQLHAHEARPLQPLLHAAPGTHVPGTQGQVSVSVWPLALSQRSCSRYSGQRLPSSLQKRLEWSSTSRWATSCSTT